MRITATISMQHYRERVIQISFACQTSEPQTILTLAALDRGTGLEVQNLNAYDDAGRPVYMSRTDQTLTINAQIFRLEYQVYTPYTQCVGFDRLVGLNYPFINTQEIFLSTGILPYPEDLPEIYRDVSLDMAVQDVPVGWGIFSNLPDRNPSPAVLEGFFIYCSTKQIPFIETYHGKAQDISFLLLGQHGITLPDTLEAYWTFINQYMRWLETFLGTYQERDEIMVLFLRAVPDFERLSNNRAFASGENVLNGIVSYGPDDAAYLRRIFGYEDFHRFLLDGLAHELMHFYTTASWQGAKKSVLYPSGDCPPTHSRLIGEGLNLYFSRQFVHRYLEGSIEGFFTQTLTHILNRHQERPRKEPLVELFLLDLHLHAHDSSLLAIFSAAVKQHQRTRIPYEDGRFLLDIAGQHLTADIPSFYYDLLLDSVIPDYPALLDEALATVGFALQ
ncbi:MAG: hypothetical protein GYB66_15115, partial [Chloroflexi bacterium]|nr:hypothetical protein [Chloroflexota bacterium]